MQHELLASVAQLTDAALLAGARSLVGRERQATARLVAHLAEIDRRGLFAGAGHGSLFAYCTIGLGLSANEAYGRIEAARVANRYPLVLDLLQAGDITFTTVGLLAAHLTPENHRETLLGARGKTRFEVERMVVALRPSPPVMPLLRKLPTPAAKALALQPAAVAVAAAATPAPVVRPVVPLAPNVYRYQVNLDEEARSLHDLARDMLGPGVTEDQLVKRALHALARDLARAKFAATDRPRRSKEPAPGSRRVPARVQRVVYVRDLGPLHVPLAGRPEMQHTAQPPVPSPPAVRGGRRSYRGESLSPLRDPQPAREPAVLRPRRIRCPADDPAAATGLE